MKETEIVQRVRLELSKGDTRLFRNNVGTGWQGIMVSHTPDRVVLKNPRIVNFGLCNGSSDLIGWRSITITPEMVGQKVAVFCALEGKSNRRGSATTSDQRTFMHVVRSMGGISGIFRGVAEAHALLVGEES